MYIEATSTPPAVRRPSRLRSISAQSLSTLVMRRPNKPWRWRNRDVRMRIGVNALYLIPGGVGGTEIYLRNLLQAWGRIDTVNEFFVFTNRETDSDLTPSRFTHAPQPVRAVNRPARLIYEQTR